MALSAKGIRNDGSCDNNANLCNNTASTDRLCEVCRDRCVIIGQVSRKRIQKSAGMLRGSLDRMNLKAG
jgi:hypothetical protein